MNSLRLMYSLTFNYQLFPVILDKNSQQTIISQFVVNIVSFICHCYCIV
uniref:Uncharacterized protein n=1 Tax=Porphyridium purpureum TaxID=35688 RepID=W0RYF0_PORPP|nr:hypothetical protein Y721_p219 [Porphyridium purpureum]BAO23589.1 hypothetical protein [Porphyridium purpureum]